MDAIKLVGSDCCVSEDEARSLIGRTIVGVEAEDHRLQLLLADGGRLDVESNCGHEESYLLVGVSDGPRESRMLDLIDEWHSRKGGYIPFHEFLGVPWESYTAWAEGRASLISAVIDGRSRCGGG